MAAVLKSPHTHVRVVHPKHHITLVWQSRDVLRRQQREFQDALDSQFSRRRSGVCVCVCVFVFMWTSYCGIQQTCVQKLIQMRVSVVGEALLVTTYTVAFKSPNASCDRSTGASLTHADYLDMLLQQQVAAKSSIPT